MAKVRLNVYFDPALFDQLEATATSRRVPKTHIVEAALASFLTPDEADQREAALVRRLDRMTRAIERFERDQEIADLRIAHLTVEQAGKARFGGGEGVIVGHVRVANRTGRKNPAFTRRARFGSSPAPSVPDPLSA